MSYGRARGSLTVAARPERVGEARRFVAAALGAEHPCVDAATEVISELVTNAMLYGSVSEHARIKVRVRLLRQRRVRLVVVDEGGTGHTPSLCRPDGDQVSGRGLLIVSALAWRWDWARHRSGHKIRVLLDPVRPGPDGLAVLARPFDLQAFGDLESAIDVEGP